MLIRLLQRTLSAALVTLTMTVVMFILMTVAPGATLTPVYGETAVKGTVTARSGFVRKDASTSSSCVFCVSKDDEVAILSETTSPDNKKWYLIKVGDSTGYIRADLVAKSQTKVEVSTNTDQAAGAVAAPAAAQTAAAPAAASPVSGTVNGDQTIVRAGQSTQTNVITSLSKGTTVTVTGAKTGTDNSKWYQVGVVKDGMQYAGYIRADLVSVSGEVPMLPADGTVTVSAANGTGQPVTGTVTPLSAGEQFRAGSVVSSIQVGKVKGMGVNVREAPVSGNVVAVVSSGQPLTVTEFVRGDDGNIWCKIAIIYNKAPQNGYIRSDFIEGINLMNPEGVMPVTAAAEVPVQAPAAAVVYTQDADFESTIAVFPESYKDPLRQLHEKYPNWIIKPVNTDLDWSTTIERESSVGKNLVSQRSISSWKSTEPQAYNWQSDTWYGFDGGSWASASKELISYYMDPRNFLDENGIFQFETLEYQDYQNTEGVRGVLEATFLAGEYTDTDGQTRSYADTFMEAGRQYGVSPYHLASRCIQEQGLNGTSESIAGNVPGLENLFNYYNIGAYAANGNTAPINGLIYASGTDEDYLRPWNSRYRSIFGSARYISDKYIQKKQNTLYFEKFNVVNSENGIYSHQYMSNILATSAEASRLRKAYSDLNTTLVFLIPYYKDMPEFPCEKPTGDSNPNNYLSALWVEGYALTPEFNTAVSTYYLIVDGSCESINIGASTVTDTASVGGTGIVPINSGTNTLTVACKAQNGNSRLYTIIVQKN
ncbi:MAG: SH3 domain-containing protein [Lachnospiraceae bacterium]|nr:SH3 domain-containing protein [Lachnospiraceae bacterium]